MAEAHHNFNWKNGVRLKEILAAFAKLPKPVRTREVLLFATDAAHLDRKFVATRMNPTLALAGLDTIDIATDAGEE